MSQRGHRQRKAKSTRSRRSSGAGASTEALLELPHGQLLLLAGDSLEMDGLEITEAWGTLNQDGRRPNVTAACALLARICDIGETVGGSQFRGVPFSVHRARLESVCPAEFLAEVHETGNAREAALRWLAVEAGESLGFNQDELARGHDAFAAIGDDPEDEDQRLGDMLEARVCDMLEAHGITEFGGATLAQLRDEMKKRQTETFLIEVRETGESPDVAALRIRYSWVYLARGLSLPKNTASWCGTNGGWRRLFTGGRRHRSGSGRRSARASSRKPASQRQSLSGSISRRSTRSRSSEPANLSTPSDEPAEPWNARRIRAIRTRRRCASSIASRVDGSHSLAVAA